MDEKYTIKIVCVEPEGSQEFEVGYEVEYFVGDNVWVTQDLAQIEFDNFEEGTNFEDYINCYHEDIEREVNKFGLTVDRFVLCKVELNLTEIAEVVV